MDQTFNSLRLKIEDVVKNLVRKYIREIRSNSKIKKNKVREPPGSQSQYQYYSQLD